MTSASGEKSASVPAPPTSIFADAPFAETMFWINVAVFVGEVLYAASRRASTGDSFVNAGLSALIDVPGWVSMTFGANYAAATLYDGRIDTLVASCFVHLSLWHIGFNMLALRALGPVLERIVGTGRTALLYVGSGIVSSMFSTLAGWLLTQERTGAGASGAICGLIGAAVLVGYRTGGWKSPLLRSTAPWLVLTLGFGAATNFDSIRHYVRLDNAAHVGGALAGAVIALLWERGPEKSNRRTLSVGLATGLLTATLVGVVARDVRDPYASMTVGDRLHAAQVALQRGNCDEALSAAIAARRETRRDPQTLQALLRVTKRCGITDS